METLVVVALLGVLAGAGVWTARGALARGEAAATRSALRALDAGLRREAALRDPLPGWVRRETPRSGARSGPIGLTLDLSAQEVRGGPVPLRLPPGLELREVWVAGAAANPRRSGVVNLSYGPAGPRTWAVGLRETRAGGVGGRGVSAWFLVAGRTGQWTRFETRRGVEAVFGVL